MIPQHLSVKVVAERLGVSARAVYELIQLGDLPAVRVGRRVVVSERALAAWLDRKKIEPPPALADPRALLEPGADRRSRGQKAGKAGRGAAP